MLPTPMAGEQKGFMRGGMKFGVGEDLPDETEKAPLLPLRVLIVADLVPSDEYNAGTSAPEGALRVDASRFDELFTKLRPRIAIEVPSVLAEGRNVRVDLSPTSLKSFRPDGLCTELPLLRSLLDGRLVLDRLRDGTVSQDQARSELDRLWGGSPFIREVLGLIVVGGPVTRAAPAAPAAPAPAAAGASIDSLLDMVDLPTSSAPVTRDAEPAAPVAMPPASKYSDFIASVARSARNNPNTPVRPTEAIARVERALGAQLGAILQHPEVRRLEETWRGLRFLVERAKAHSGIRFDVVSADARRAAAAMTRAVKDSALTDPPISCAIVDITVDGTAASFASLESISAAAEAHTVPTVVSGSAKLLGLDNLALVEPLDNKAALFAAPHQAPWRSAASKPAMRWVTIAMNRALSRAPYDKTSSRVREAAIKELPDDDGAYVWMSPAWMVGSLVLSSFRDTGWPCRIVGVRSGGLVENMPVREVKNPIEGEEGVAIPTEAFVTTETQRELAKSGVLLMAAAANSDTVYVLHAPTAYVTPPKRTYDSDTTEPEVRLDRVSLGDQLFVARLAQFLRALCSKIPPDSDPAEVTPVVEGAVWALFEDAAPAGPQLTVKTNPGQGGGVVEVTVRPRRFLGVSIEEISLEMPLG